MLAFVALRRFFPRMVCASVRKCTSGVLFRTLMGICFLTLFV